jgi:hypothetical protein
VLAGLMGLGVDAPPRRFAAPVADVALSAGPSLEQLKNQRDELWGQRDALFVQGENGKRPFDTDEGFEQSCRLIGEAALLQARIDSLES